MKLSRVILLVAPIVLAACIPSNETIYMPKGQQGYLYSSCSGLKNTAFRQLNEHLTYVITTGASSGSLDALTIQLHVQPGSSVRLQSSHINLTGESFTRELDIENIIWSELDKDDNKLIYHQAQAADELIGFEGPTALFYSYDWQDWGGFSLIFEFEAVTADTLSVQLPGIAMAGKELAVEPIQLEKEVDGHWIDIFCT
jgi:hypothetical protein